MGLPKAIKAHANDDLDKAMHEYQRAFEQNIKNPALFQNYGSLLAQHGKDDEALKVYQKGVLLHPENTGILRNYANFMRKKKSSISIYLYQKCLFELSRSEKKFSLKVYKEVLGDLLDLLVQQNLTNWALALARDSMTSIGFTPSVIKSLVLITDQLARSSPKINPLKLDSKIIKNVLNSDCSVKEQLSLHFAFAFHYSSNKNNYLALQCYHDAMSIYERNVHNIPVDDEETIRQMIHDNSWNLACFKLQIMDYEGWKLFDHGLQARAMGKQCWQRALVKPFTYQEVKPWRGDSLKGKSILLLEEQAVGDAMMFLTLIPRVLEVCNSVGLYLSSRLVPIYKRTFSHEITSGRVQIFSKSSVIDKTLTTSMYDYQSPLGSICQYIYSTFASFTSSKLILNPNSSLRDKLQSNSLYSFLGSKSKPLTVGISWRGGGREDRIKQKSLPLDLFTSLISKFPHIKFVSLQYGDCSSQCDMWSKEGIDIVHDSRVNALKDMDTWLAQVDICDAVLSVANTTIHGAAGLGKPTMCLLSIHSDWRWFTDPSITRSYWYPSVGIARQDPDGSWDKAIGAVSSWLENGCPFPTGPQF